MAKSVKTKKKLNAKKKPKKAKEAPIDGMSPKAMKQLASAIKQVWSWSTPRRLAKKRATDKAGYERCEKCGKRAPKTHVDHIIPCGEITSPGYFERLYVSSSGLQVLCKRCHAPKTKAENAGRREKRRVALLQEATVIANEEMEDFY